LTMVEARAGGLWRQSACRRIKYAELQFKCADASRPRRPRSSHCGRWNQCSFPQKKIAPRNPGGRQVTRANQSPDTKRIHKRKRTHTSARNDCQTITPQASLTHTHTPHTHTHTLSRPSQPAWETKRRSYRHALRQLARRCDGDVWWWWWGGGRLPWQHMTLVEAGSLAVMVGPQPLSTVLITTHLTTTAAQHHHGYHGGRERSARRGATRLTTRRSDR
jgi:hypothetical protein